MKAVVGFAQSLLSRKFALAVAGIIVAVANRRYNDVAPIVAAYLAAEGIGDAAARFGSKAPSPTGPPPGGNAR